MDKSMVTQTLTRIRGSEMKQFDAFLSSNPVSVGVLAGVVTMAGQTAAQFELPSHTCRIVALAFAALLACYQVRFAQNRSMRESVFLVPIVSVIIFTTGLGTNGLIADAQAKTPVTREAPAERKVSPLEQLSELFIPSAHAANQDDRDRKRKQGGWKRW
jgi:hypothetical protein